MDQANSFFNKGYTVPVSISLILALLIFGIAYLDLRTTTPPPMYDLVGEATSTPPVAASTSRYVDKLYGYSFEYPALLDKSEGQLRATSDYDNIKADSLFIASFPKDFGKGTNLSSLSVMSGIRDVKKEACHTTMHGSNVASSSPRFKSIPVNIEGVEFFLASIEGIGAGNLYVTTRYTTVHKNQCYSIAIVAHSFNDIETFNQDNPKSLIKRYDQDKIDAILDKIVQSFTFTD